MSCLFYEHPISGLYHQSCSGRGGHPTHIITPEAGHALEILGHAIDYLTDEFVYQGGTPVQDRGRVEAIQLLMERNRQIYYACPVAQPFSEKARAWGHRLLSFHH